MFQHCLVFVADAKALTGLADGHSAHGFGEVVDNR